MLYLDEVDESGLIDLDLLGVPFLEVLAADSGVGGGGGGVLKLGGMGVLGAVLDDYGEELGVNVGDQDAVIGAVILNHVADGLRLHRHRLLHLEFHLVGALESDHLLLALAGCHRNPSSYGGGK